MAQVGLAWLGLGWIGLGWVQHWLVRRVGLGWRYRLGVLAWSGFVWVGKGLLGLALNYKCGFRVAWVGLGMLGLPWVGYVG